MSADEYRGVVDRFEGDVAVVLLERDGTTVDDITVPRAELPEEGRHQDAIFTVVMENENVQQISYQSEETSSRAEQAQSRFDRLSERPPDKERD